MNKLPLIQLVPTLKRTGPVNVVYNLLSHLDPAVFGVRVVALSDDAGSDVAGFEEAFPWLDGVEVLGYSRWVLEFGLAGIARRLTKRFGGEGTIVHAHCYYPTLLAARMGGVATVVTIHNRCGEDYVMNKGRLMGGYMCRRFRRALRRVTAPVAISDGMEPYYAADVRPGALRTIYNGVEPGPVASPAERAEAKAGLDLATDRKVLLYPAAFVSLKNQARLIDEVRRLERHDFVVAFAGDGPEAEACRRLAADDDRFAFLGYRRDMDHLWQAADLMVSPSRSEGMPMAVLEALLHGVPTVLSDIPSHREIMRHVFGDERRCFALDRPGSLAEQLADRLDETVDGLTVRACAARCYGAPKMAADYAALYRSLAWA